MNISKITSSDTNNELQSYKPNDWSISVNELLRHAVHMTFLYGDSNPHLLSDLRAKMHLMLDRAIDTIENDIKLSEKKDSIM